MENKRLRNNFLRNKWWARPDLNWRPSPCQGDVITPRPRARWTVDYLLINKVYQIKALDLLKILSKD